MEPHIRKSLIDAGIGPIYHDKKLSEIGDDGAQLWKHLHSDLRREIYTGAFLTLEGYDRETVMTFAKTLHINGVGVRIMAASKLWTKMQHPGSEAWEAINDSPMLILNPAQTNRPCPLEGWQRDAMEEYLACRIERRQSVTFASYEQISVEAGWWSSSFLWDVRAKHINLQSICAAHSATSP